MGHGHGRSAIMIMSSSSVTTSIAEFDFLVSFLQGLFMASKNADLLYFGGPWTDYQCHSEETSNQPHYQFEVQLLGLGPCGFPSFFGFRRPVRSFVPCIANNDYR